MASDTDALRAKEDARRLLNSAYRLENDPVRGAFHHKGISFSSPHIQRAIPRIAQPHGATRIQGVSARCEVLFVDVPFGKRPRHYPIDPYCNWDIDSQNRRMLQPDAPPISEAVGKDRIARTRILRLTGGNMLRTREEQHADS